MSFVLGFAAVVVVAAAGPLFRFQRIDLPASQHFLLYGGLAGVAAILLGAITASLARPGEGRRGFVAGSLGVVLGIAAAWMPMQWLYLSQTLPPIHDVSTDTVEPPAFVAVPRLRTAEHNALAYEGKRIAELQRTGYPDLKPLLLPVPASEAFARAERAAADMGWHIIETVPGEGRIEATARTLWFGFEDDVIIRVRSTAAGSRVDVRSASRLGVSDLGVNAERIRRFLRRLAG